MKFRYKLWFKALAFCLGCLCAAGAVFCAAVIAENTDLQWEYLVKSAYIDTEDYSYVGSTIVENVRDMAERFIDDASVAAYIGISDELKKLEQQRDTEIARETADANVRKSVLESGRPSERPSVNEVYLYYKAGAWYVDEAQITADVTYRCNEQIRLTKERFVSDYAIAKHNLEGLESIKYVYRNEDTGKVLTNIEDPDPWTAFDSLELESLWFFGSVKLGFDEAAAKAQIESGDMDWVTGNYAAFQSLKELQGPVLAAFACLLLLGLLLAVSLIQTAGLDAKEAKVLLSRSDQIPNGLHWIPALGMGLVTFSLCEKQAYDTYPSAYWWIIACVGVTVLAAVLGEVVLSVTRHIRNKSFFSNAALGWLYRKFVKYNPTRTIILAIAGFGVLLLLPQVLAFLDPESGFAPLGIFVTLIAMVGVYFLLGNLRRGIVNLETVLDKRCDSIGAVIEDVKRMPSILQPLYEKVRDLQKAVQKAVADAIKGEQLKTELITNVSHDLKTPLTAITNYVDLLQKPETTDAQKAEYLGVLSQKSAQLKVLIEDLTEAAKASSGNVELHPVAVNLAELAAQAVGEISSAFAEKGLLSVVQGAESAPAVLADSKAVWRVVQNLMNNAAKYSMPGTRVYIQLSTTETTGSFTVLNVSAAPIGIPAEELMQRFVRGDASRHSDGSGLGLNIAESLCRLMGGKLTISTDGDLFRVTAQLPKA